MSWVRGVVVLRFLRRCKVIRRRIGCREVFGSGFVFWVGFSVFFGKIDRDIRFLVLGGIF